MSPKFARAMAVTAGETAEIFISGTASITGSDTRFAGDMAEQTRQTLDNIEALISAENFARHGLPGWGATLGDLALARVYVKRGEQCAAGGRFARPAGAFCPALTPSPTYAGGNCSWKSRASL